MSSWQRQNHNQNRARSSEDSSTSGQGADAAGSDVERLRYVRESLANIMNRHHKAINSKANSKPNASLSSNIDEYQSSGESELAVEISEALSGSRHGSANGTANAKDVNASDNTKPTKRPRGSNAIRSTSNVISEENEKKINKFGKSYQRSQRVALNDPRLRRLLGDPLPLYNSVPENKASVKTKDPVEKPGTLVDPNLPNLKTKVTASTKSGFRAHLGNNGRFLYSASLPSENTPTFHDTNGFNTEIDAQNRASNTDFGYYMGELRSRILKRPVTLKHSTLHKNNVPVEQKQNEQLAFEQSISGDMETLVRKADEIDQALNAVSEDMNDHRFSKKLDKQRSATYTENAQLRWANVNFMLSALWQGILTIFRQVIRSVWKSLRNKYLILGVLLLILVLLVVLFLDFASLPRGDSALPAEDSGYMDYYYFY